MLYVDGIKYKLMTPASEEELEKMIEEHFKKIFGEDSLYFPVKLKLKSLGGIGSIPDGYAITLSKPYKWYIVEVELSNHPVFEHIVPQLNRFVQGLGDQSSRKNIVEAIYNEIKNDPFNELYIKEKIDSGEIYRFLSSTIEKNPILAVIIDQKTMELEEACNSVPITDKSISEFKIYERIDAGIKNAFFIEPLEYMQFDDKERSDQSYEERFFDYTKKNSPAQVFEIIIDIYKWSEDNSDKIFWGLSETSSFTFHYIRNGKVISPFTVYPDGRLRLNFGWLSKRLKKETYDKFIKTISEIPTFGNRVTKAKYPSIKITIFLEHNKDLQAFKEAVIELGKNIS